MYDSGGVMWRNGIEKFLEYRPWGWRGQHFQDHKSVHFLFTVCLHQRTMLLQDQKNIRKGIQFAYTLAILESD